MKYMLFCSACASVVSMATVVMLHAVECSLHIVFSTQGRLVQGVLVGVANNIQRGTSERFMEKMRDLEFGKSLSDEEPDTQG